MALQTLARGANELGIPLTAQQVDQFEALTAELVGANRAMNLTRVVEVDDVQSRHFLDSLTCAIPVLTELLDGAEWTCIDVGSGAGFPGLPLAIAFPSLRVALLEATGKKARFLERVVGLLRLSRVTTVNARAEEAARDPAHRDAYDLAVARALAPLPVALELCLPFVRPAGRLVLPRGTDLPAQLDDGVAAARELGADLLPIHPVELLDLPPHRTLVVAEKRLPTAQRYPRRVGVAAKRPLGRKKYPLA
jgi:16S rRNA (guanine527-N7)-methyltransferase